MMTSKPLDHKGSDSASAQSDAGTAGVRLAETARETENATWLDHFTMELRLLEVPGDAIGDAVASAREFLADSGSTAEESFGSAQLYAAALDLPTLPQAGASSRVTLVTSGIGAIGLVVLAQASVPLATGDEALVVRLWMLIGLAAMMVTIALLPKIIPWIVRARPSRLWLFACGLPIVCWGPFALIVYQGQLIVFTLPTVPIAIAAAVLLLAPPIFNQMRHTFQDDPIIQPGGDPEPRPTWGARVLYLGGNWIMVVYGAVSFVLILALYPNT